MRKLREEIIKLSADLYPDVVEWGGLGAAMLAAAEVRECDLGDINDDALGVRIDSERGVISVNMAADERSFLIGIYVPGFTWAVGSTDDLGRLVDAVGAWRAGISLNEFESNYPFMTLDDFARSLESGNLTAFQWERLLSLPFYLPQNDLLRLIHSDGQLRTLFPVVSHGVIRLWVDPMDGASLQFLVKRLMGGDRYHVAVVDGPQPTWQEVPAANLLDHLRVLLGSR